MRTLRPKCYICEKACRKNQKQLKCSLCDKFVHRKCSNLTVTDIYRHEECNIPFYCKKCSDTIYPLSNEDDLDPVLNLSYNRVQFDCGISLDPDHLNNIFQQLLKTNQMKIFPTRMKGSNQSLISIITGKVFLSMNLKLLQIIKLRTSLAHWESI